MVSSPPEKAITSFEAPDLKKSSPAPPTKVSTPAPPVKLIPPS